MSDDQDKKIDAPGGPIAEQRRHQRMEVPEHVTATIIGEDGVERDVTVKDLSVDGAWLIVDDSFENDDFVELHVGRLRQNSGSGRPGIRRRHRRRV